MTLHGGGGGGSRAMTLRRNKWVHSAVHVAVAMSRIFLCHLCDVLCGREN